MSVGWSDLHPELLAEIFRRVDVVDYIRCLSVCTSWRSIPDKTMNFCKPKIVRQAPWLLISSPDDEPGSRRFYAPSLLHAKTAAKYTMHLPQIAHHTCIGSSRGFLITVDGAGKLHATNPLTGARFPLPPTATHPDLLIYHKSLPDVPPRLIVPTGRVCVGYRKAVISPSMDTIAVAAQGFAYDGESRFFVNIAFARAGDGSWTALVPPCTQTRHCMARDFTFHKGRVYVLYHNGYHVAFDLENPAAPPLVLPRMLEVKAASFSFLIESPDGQDLLLLLISLTMPTSPDMVVYMLDKNTLEWNRVQSIGDVALFVGGRYHSSLSTRELPCLKSNCIYFVNSYPIDLNARQIRVYDLEDGSVHLLSPDDELVELLPPLVWFTPAL